jgi:peptide chain release factor 2
MAIVLGRERKILGVPAAPADTVDPAMLPMPVLELTDFKRDLSELTERLGHAQDCL